MPKNCTFPVLYDNVKTVSASLLGKKWGGPASQLKTGTVTWTRCGQYNGSISIKADTNLANPYIELDYQCNGVPINYKVRAVFAPSNLGRGIVWYFICPVTGKRCRKLYLLGKYFCHRSAVPGCMYEKQTQSKRYRNLDKTLGAYFRADQLHSQLQKRYFKKQYAGKPTKKYLKLTRQLQVIDDLEAYNLELNLLRNFD